MAEQLPAIEGAALARSRTRALAHSSYLLVFAAAFFLIGFVAGQLFQQMNHDLRTAEIDQRV